MTLTPMNELSDVKIMQKNIDMEKINPHNQGGH
jgi:hypothetical protein